MDRLTAAMLRELIVLFCAAAFCALATASIIIIRKADWDAALIGGGVGSVVVVVLWMTGFISSPDLKLSSCVGFFRKLALRLSKSWTRTIVAAAIFGVLIFLTIRLGWMSVLSPRLQCNGASHVQWRGVFGKSKTRVCKDNDTLELWLPTKGLRRQVACVLVSYETVAAALSDDRLVCQITGRSVETPRQCDSAGTSSPINGGVSLSCSSTNPGSVQNSAPPKSTSVGIMPKPHPSSSKAPSQKPGGFNFTRSGTGGLMRPSESERVTSSTSQTASPLQSFGMGSPKSSVEVPTSGLSTAYPY